MRSIGPAACVIAVLIAFCLPHAAGAGEDTSGNFEITPFAGYTWGGQFTDSVTGVALQVDETNSYGLMLDIKQDEQGQIELYFSRQPTRLKRDRGALTGDPLFNLDIDYYHIGGTYGTNSGSVRPFMVGTLGVTHMDPSGPGLDSLTKFSLSLGGGVKLFVTDRIGLRFDGRWFGTLFNGSGSAFCSSGSGCAINIQGELFSQFVANAGVILTF